MKKIALFSSVLALFACNEATEPSPDYVLFAGAISNSDASSLLVYSDDFKEEITVEEDGTFSDTLFIEENGYYSYRIGRESSSFHLEKGDSLHLSIDTKEFDETIVYTGNGAEESNLLAKRYLLNEELMPSAQVVYSLEEAEFLNKVVAIRTKNEDLIKQSKAKEAFKNQQLEDAKYAFAYALSNYSNYHGYFSGNKDFTPSKDFDKNQIDFALNNEDAFAYSENYKDLVMSSINKRIKVDENTSFSEAAIKVLSQLEDGMIKEEVLAYYSRRLMSPDEDLSENYEFLMANTSDTATKAAYESKYEVLKNLLKGMPSPAFTNYENHKGGNTSLEDLKGKYTYIDVWATWCGPCIREIPHLKEIEEEFQGKNIQFVSTSIDEADDHDTWVNMVSEKELSGTQLMADNAWKSQFAKDYGIESIPRFILVDPDGNIVSANAPRPSDPDLKALFEELNI